MKRRGQGVHQLTALLVLAIITAASGLPHWHPSPPKVTGTVPGGAQSTTAFLVSDSDADLFECAACVLQRILNSAQTQCTEAPPRPSLQADVEPTPDRLVSTLPLRYTDPRGPPIS